MACWAKLLPTSSLVPPCNERNVNKGRKSFQKGAVSVLWTESKDPTEEKEKPEWRTMMCCVTLFIWFTVRIWVRPVSQRNSTPSQLFSEKEVFVKANWNVFMEEKHQPTNDAHWGVRQEDWTQSPHSPGGGNIKNTLWKLKAAKILAVSFRKCPLSSNDANTFLLYNNTSLVWMRSAKSAAFFLWI